MDTGLTPVASTISGLAILHGSSVGLYLEIDSQVLESAYDGGVTESTGNRKQCGESVHER